MLPWGFELVLSSNFYSASNNVFVELSLTSKVISMPSWSSEFVIPSAKETTINEEFGRGIAQGLI